MQYKSELRLSAAYGNAHSAFSDVINGATYELDDNPMGIKSIKLTFCDGAGKFEYKNAQGEKVITFGMCNNEYALFPEEGYSDEVGAISVQHNVWQEFPLACNNYTGTSKYLSILEQEANAIVKTLRGSGHIRHIALKFHN